MEELRNLKKAIYFISFPMSFIGFILPIYASEMGASVIDIGILYSIFSLSSVIMRPFVGKWIDDKGRKSGIIIGLLSYIFVQALFLIGKDFKFIFLARIVQSIGASFLWISVNTMISDVSYNSNRSKNYGIIEQISNKGAFIGSTIGFILLINQFTDNQYSIIFSIYFIISAYAFYIGITQIRETYEKRVYQQKENSNINTKFIKFLLVIGILAISSSMMAPVYLIYVRSHITKDIGLISMTYIPGALLSMKLPQKFGELADRYKRSTLLTVGVIIQGAFTLIIPLGQGYIPFMIIFTMATLGGIISLPAKNALITDMTGGQQKGRAYGLYHLALGIGGIIGPIIGSYLYEQWVKSTVFYVNGIVLIVGAIVIGIILRDKQAANFTNNI